ncbi:FlgN protein [Idiomarina fontislapidosi]|uniref:Flagellar biosynthesis protein FlgN n=1 Tax=Idiomarina fontislapidosi TaxID=263723 RepID=A0A432XYD3_9GAMM|nr:flagellar export chaperone FlgN [Idiomarina fontislapidosi]PYE32784.1 FlgN protein [Idiomarina fontislapidosi]RUO53775.1 flagellar biosynthesis protein FlgN [Idiomarina fontislapidosi]
MTPITEVLEQMAEALQQLQQCQEQELAAIVERKHQSVAELTTLKTNLLDQLSEYDRVLAEHPERQQLTTDEVLSERVAELRATLSDVKRQNDVNERVVTRTLSNIDQLKHEIVRHASQARGDTLTYNAKGKIR